MLREGMRDVSLRPGVSFTDAGEAPCSSKAAAASVSRCVKRLKTFIRFSGYRRRRPNLLAKRCKWIWSPNRFRLKRLAEIIETVKHRAGKNTLIEPDGAKLKEERNEFLLNRTCPFGCCFRKQRVAAFTAEKKVVAAAKQSKDNEKEKNVFKTCKHI